MQTSADTDSSRLGKNILWNYLSGFTSVFGLLLLYPLAVGIVGADSYGLWVLAIGAIQMLTMTDFGLGSGVVRMLTGIPVGEEHDRDRRALVTAALLVFGILALIMTVLYLVIFPLYLRTVTIHPQDRDVVVPMVAMAAATLFISMVGRGLNSVLWGLNRPDIERKAAVIAIILRAAGYGGVLLTGTGLLGIIVVECVSLVLPPIVCAVVVAARFGMPVIEKDLWSRHAKPLLKLSSMMSIGALALLGVYQLPLFLVGPTLGLDVATAFGALMRVFQSMRLIVSWVTLPYGYPMRVAPDRATVARVLRSCLTLTLGLGFLMSAALISIPTELMTAWMGDQFAFAAGALAVLSVGVMAEATYQPLNQGMVLRGSALRASLMSLVVLVLTVPAVWAATTTDSLTLVALATVGPLFLVAMVQIRVATRQVPIDAGAQDLKRWGVMAAGAAAFGAVVAVASHWLPAWPAIILCAAGCGVMALRMMKQVKNDGALSSGVSVEADGDLDGAGEVEQARETPAPDTAQPQPVQPVPAPASRRERRERDASS